MIATRQMVYAPLTQVKGTACGVAFLLAHPAPPSARSPRLAGQNSAYLLDTMAAYATGERANSTVMGPLMQSLPPTDRKPIAEYLAALR